MSTTTIITRPDADAGDGAVRKDELARRLARIADQHTPYNDALDRATGTMCRECGYIAPCPTARMCDDADPEGDWLAASQ